MFQKEYFQLSRPIKVPAYKEKKKKKEKKNRPKVL